MRSDNVTEKNTIILACLAVLCTQAGMLMYAPSMPHLATVFNVTYTEIAYTFTGYLFGYAVAMFGFGGISDQLGRKNSYLIALAIFTLASFLLIFTQSIYVFIVLRLIQGVGGGGCAVIGRASVRDVCKGASLASAMSYISMTFNVSMGVFQFVGGMVQSYVSYKMDFIFMGCLGLVLFMLVICMFKETHHQSKKDIVFSEFIQNYWFIIKEKRLIMMAAVAGMGYSILLVFNVLGLYYVQDILNATPKTIGEIGLYFSLSYLAGGIVVNALLRYLDIHYILNVGKSIILFAGLIALFNAVTHQNLLPIVLVPFLLGLFGQAIFYPCLMTKTLEPYAAFPGAASSLFGFTQQLTGFFISLIASWMPHNTAYSLAIILFSIGLGVFIILPRKISSHNVST